MLQCPEPGCSEQRNDARGLSSHRRAAHGYVSPRSKELRKSNRRFRSKKRPRNGEFEITGTAEVKKKRGRGKDKKPRKLGPATPHRMVTVVDAIAVIEAEIAGMRRAIDLLRAMA